MVDKIKRGEPLYGVSQLSPYLQSVGARNSRYNVLFSSAITWPNFVNHNLVRGASLLFSSFFNRDAVLPGNC